MHYLTILRLLILLTLANGSPVVAKLLFGRSFSVPVDGSMKFSDGQRLFGDSKTLRGILASVAVTSACAPLLGFEFGLGVLVAITAMGGDLFSSFCKRRLGYEPSSRAVGLDQIPESLFPLLACQKALSLSITDVAAGTVMFFIGELLLSRVLFALHIRDRPY